MAPSIMRRLVASWAALTSLGAATLTAQGSTRLSAVSLQRIDSVAMAELRSSRTPGAALAIVIGDSIVYAQGYGLADAESGAPMRADMLFRLGSTTKMMTALAAVQLAARGVVKLDQPIGEIAPEIVAPRIRSLTLRQLLTHSAGLLDYTSMTGPHDDAALNAFIPTLTDTVFFTAPSDIYSYSNLGFAIAGYVMSRATKQPYADVMRAEVFKPLGMARSTMRPIEAMTYPLAQGHEVGAEGFSVIRPAPDDSRYWPAGSAFSTVFDLSRLAIALLNNGHVRGAAALPAGVVETMVTPQVAVPMAAGRPSVRYAFGLNVGTWGRYRMIQHGGSRAGYGSLFRLLPDQRAAIIVLGNRSGASLSRTLEAATEAVTGANSAPDAASGSATPLNATDAARLAGRWSNGQANWIEIAADASAGATLALPGGRPAVPLRRTGDNAFLAGTQELVLTTGADGRTMYFVMGSRAFRRNDPPAATPKR